MANTCYFLIVQSFGMGMGFLVLFWVLGFALGGASISMSLATKDSYQNLVQKECSFTRYPSLCVETLIRLGSGNQHVDIVSTLLNKTISETKLATSNIAKFSSQFGAQEAERAHSVTGGNQDQQLISRVFFVDAKCY